MKRVPFFALLLLLIPAALGWTPYAAGEGSAHYDDLTAAVALTDTPLAGVALPSSARIAFIHAEVADVRFTLDGGDPTALGIVLAAGKTLVLPDPQLMRSIQFAEAVAANGAELQIQYAKR